jgi:hypothetical protein
MDTVTPRATMKIVTGMVVIARTEALASRILGRTPGPARGTQEAGCVRQGVQTRGSLIDFATRRAMLLSAEWMLAIVALPLWYVILCGGSLLIYTRIVTFCVPAADPFTCELS